MAQPPSTGRPAVVDRPVPVAASDRRVAPHRAFPVGKPIATLAAVAIPVVLGSAVALSPKPAFIAFAGVAGIVGLMAALASPRWALVGTLFLLVGYLPDVVGGGDHKIASAALPIMLVTAVVVRHITGTERVTLPGDLRWFVFFGVALLIVTATAGQQLMSEFSDFAGFALLAAAMMILIDSQVWLRRALWAIVSAAAMLAAISVVQQLTKTYGSTYHGLALITPDQSGMRSGGPLSPDYFAEVLVSAAVLSGYLALRARSLAERWVAIAATGVMLLAVLYTQSRGGLIAFAVATIVVLVLRRAPVSMMVFAVGVVAIAGVFILPSAVQHRISDLTTLKAGGGTSDSSLRGRVAENLAAVEMFGNHALVGVGPDNFELHYLAYAQKIGLDPRAEVRGAHSLYLESLAELGLVGSIPFFALLGMGLRRAWRARARTRGDLGLLTEACFVAWLAFLVSAAALHLSYPRYLWIFLALAFTAGRQLPNRRSA